jgi:hypothetical protein
MSLTVSNVPLEQQSYSSLWHDCFAVPQVQRVIP